MERKRDKASQKNRIHIARILKREIKRCYYSNDYQHVSECNVMLHIVGRTVKINAYHT